MNDLILEPQAELKAKIAAHQAKDAALKARIAELRSKRAELMGNIEFVNRVTG